MGRLKLYLLLLPASIMTTFIFTGIQGIYNITHALTSEPQYSNILHLSACKDLTQSNTLYILDNDVRSEGTCFAIKASNVTFDLNGHTIIYDDYPNTGLPNPDFELGNGNIPSDWDLSQAPTVKRKPTTDFAMVNKWYLFFDNASNGTKIISPWTLLPPNSKAVAYFIRGDAVWAYQQAPLWNIKVESEDGAIAFSKDFTEEQKFEFTTATVERKYRAILTLADGYGLKLLNYGRYPSVDLFDLRPAYNYGIKTEYQNNIIIKNGKIIQGRGKSLQGHAISNYAGGNLTVYGIYFENYGMESSAVSTNWASDVTVKDSSIINRNPYKFNRHQLGAAITASNGNNILIANNTMDCGSGWGCIYTSGDSNAEISYNNVKTESVITNHHAINGGMNRNVLIHDNIIEANPGQGIGTSPDGGDIYNNTITIRKTAPNFEYGYYQSDAITLKDYGNKYCKNVKVHDNTINLFGEYDKSYVSGGLINGIMDMCTGGNVSYSNNKITAKSIDPGVIIAGINPGGKYEYEETFFNNTIESDMYNILFGGYAGQGDVISNIRFISNTLIKGSNPTNYHTFGQERGGQFSSDKTHFIDTRLLKGASIKDVQPGYYGYNYFADWYLNVFLKDQSGNPLPNANVSVKEKNNTIVFSGVTDHGGKIERIVLSEFKNTKGSFEYFSPHTVTIFPAGQPQVTKEIYMDGSKDLSYQVGGTVEISNVPLTDPSPSQVSKILLHAKLESDTEINSPTIVTEKVSGWETGAAIQESGSGNVTYESGYDGQAARLNGSLNNDEKLIFAARNFDFSDMDGDGGRLDFWLKFNVDPHTYAGNKFILRTEPYPPVITIEIYGSNPYLVFEFGGNGDNPETNYRFMAYTANWNKWLNWKKDEWHLITLSWKRNQGAGNAEMHLYIDGTQDGCPVNNCNDYYGILSEPTAWNEVVVGNYYSLATDFSIDELKSLSSTTTVSSPDITPPLSPKGLTVK